MKDEEKVEEEVEEEEDDEKKEAEEGYNTVTGGWKTLFWGIGARGCSTA